MRVILFAFLACLLVVSQVSGQQRSQYTQYMMNNYILNPALSGIEDYTDVKMATRHQWVGLDGAPVTYYISAHTPLGKEVSQVKSGGSRKGVRKVNRNRFNKPYPHHGVGVMAMADKTGELKRNSFSASYAYHLPLTKDISFSTGAYGGVVGNTFNTGGATYINPDPAVSAAYINKTYLDLGAGIWIYSRDFFVGFSGAQLLKSTQDVNSTESGSAGQLQRHFYGTGGYKIRLSPDFSFIPSVLVKVTPPSPVSVDLNLKAVYADRVWIGGSYRSKDSFSAMVGANVSYLLEVGYSYDLNTSNLSIANTGTHEVVIGLKLFNKGRAICPHWMQ